MKFKHIIIRSVFLIFLVLIFLFYLSREEKPYNSSKENLSNENRGYFRIMFYNTENLFDTYDDSLKQDDEFLPDGVRFWTFDRYKQKLNKIYKVIVAVGGWDPPEIVGLCEVENQYVLQGLVNQTPLSKFEYQIIHKESPDIRGIDVALLYLKDKFTILKSNFYPIVFPFDSIRKTRDILYVKGKTNKNDTLHLFVNHWPSRWGGQFESEPNRIFVASVLKQTVDSIFKINSAPNIIIMGDFNDEPENISILNTLNANIAFDDIKDNKLYNLSWYLKQNKNLGSYKYQGVWGMFDQFIVSGSLLLNKHQNLHLSVNDIHVFKADFLLERDENHFGFKPFRTYTGYRYNNGFSDHLPIYMDLKKK